MRPASTQADLTLTGPPGFGDDIEGEALVSAHGFSARYDLDPATGVISRASHDLAGASIVDKILVFATAKGGVATAWRLLDLAARATAPRALIFDTTNPVMVQGAVLADLPIVHALSPPAVTTIRSGDWLRLRPADGTVDVWRWTPPAPPPVPGQQNASPG